MCEAPFAPVVESERVPTRPGLNPKAWKHGDGDDVGQRSTASPNLDPKRHIAISACHGYRPTCTCGREDSIGCMVMDPFSGIGTVAQTARQLGARAISIDLNPEYHAIACKRVMEPPRWWICREGLDAKQAKAAGESPLLALLGPL